MLSASTEQLSVPVKQILIEFSDGEIKKFNDSELTIREFSCNYDIIDVLDNETRVIKKESTGKYDVTLSFTGNCRK
jgi:hypothetical protein